MLKQAAPKVPERRSLGQQSKHTSYAAGNRLKSHLKSILKGCTAPGCNPSTQEENHSRSKPVEAIQQESLKTMPSSKGSVKQSVSPLHQVNTLASSPMTTHPTQDPISHTTLSSFVPPLFLHSASNSGLRMQKQAFLKTGNLSQMWQHTPLTTALWRQRQAVLCEVVSSLGYIVSSRVS